MEVGDFPPAALEFLARFLNELPDQFGYEDSKTLEGIFEDFNLEFDEPKVHSNGSKINIAR